MIVIIVHIVERINNMICFIKNCKKEATTKLKQDDHWYCEEHAKEEVKLFINALMELGGVI